MAKLKRNYVDWDVDGKDLIIYFEYDQYDEIQEYRQVDFVPDDYQIYIWGDGDELESENLSPYEWCDETYTVVDYIKMLRLSEEDV